MNIPWHLIWRLAHQQDGLPVLGSALYEISDHFNIWRDRKIDTTKSYNVSKESCDELYEVVDGYLFRFANSMYNDVVLCVNARKPPILGDINHLLAVSKLAPVSCASLEVALTTLQQAREAIDNRYAEDGAERKEVSMLAVLPTMTEMENDMKRPEKKQEVTGRAEEILETFDKLAPLREGPPSASQGFEMKYGYSEKDMNKIASDMKISEVIPDEGSGCGRVFTETVIHQDGLHETMANALDRPIIDELLAADGESDKEIELKKQLNAVKAQLSLQRIPARVARNMERTEGMIKFVSKEVGLEDFLEKVSLYVNKVKSTLQGDDTEFTDTETISNVIQNICNDVLHGYYEHDKSLFDELHPSGLYSSRDRNKMVLALQLTHAAAIQSAVIDRIKKMQK